MIRVSGVNGVGGVDGVDRVICGGATLGAFRTTTKQKVFHRR